MTRYAISGAFALLLAALFAASFHPAERQEVTIISLR